MGKREEDSIQFFRMRDEFSQVPSKGISSRRMHFQNVDRGFVAGCRPTATLRDEPNAIINYSPGDN